MADVQASTVTFLFTDIEGSTRLVRKLRDGYAAVLAEHQRLLREAFQTPWWEGDRHPGGFVLRCFSAGA